MTALDHWWEVILVVGVPFILILILYEMRRPWESREGRASVVRIVEVRVSPDDRWALGEMRLVSV